MLFLVLLSNALALVLAQQPRIILSDEPWSVGNSQSLQRIQWQSGKATGMVYCISEKPIITMRFICPDCNSTEIDENLSKFSEDKSLQAGYPTLQLANMPVTKELNGKTLVCEGIYDPNSMGLQQPNAFPSNNGNNDDDMNNPNNNVVSSQASIVVFYLDTPEIRDSRGGAPLISEAGGGQFFYIPTSGASLMCAADGNPPPREYRWRKDGAEVPGATGASLSVVTGDISASIQCSVDNGIMNNPLDSPAVALELFVEPSIVLKNFEQVQKNTPFEGNNRIQLQRNVGMNCYATGNPKPDIMWLQQVGQSGMIVNASCSQSNEGYVAPMKSWPPNSPIVISNEKPVIFADRWTVQSQCTVQVDSYADAGRVWCSACSIKSAGQYTCSPPQNAPPADAVQFDVFGKPQPSANQSGIDIPTAEETSDNSALITAPYCADPQPSASERYWLIDGTRLDMGDRTNNIVADNPRPDTIYPDCYTARLRIESYSVEDTRRNIQLVVKNRYGQLDGATVNLEGLLGGAVNNAGTDVGLAVGLAIGLFVLLVLLVLAFLWWRRLGCFAGKMSKRESTRGNIAPEHVRSAEPVKAPLGGSQYTSEPYSPQQQTQQEGINYAELDLVNTSSRPPSVINPTQYSQVQPAPSSYSPHSVV